MALPHWSCFLFYAKLIWENTVGSSGTAELIGSPVLVEAHLLGVIWGVIFALAYIIWAIGLIRIKLHNDAKGAHKISQLT